MDTFPSPIKADDRRNEPGALLPCTLTSGQARQRTVFRGIGTLACAPVEWLDLRQQVGASALRKPRCHRPPERFHRHQAPAFIVQNSESTRHMVPNRIYPKSLKIHVEGSVYSTLLPRGGMRCHWVHEVRVKVKLATPPSGDLCKKPWSARCSASRGGCVRAAVLRFFDFLRRRLRFKAAATA